MCPHSQTWLADPERGREMQWADSDRAQTDKSSYYQGEQNIRIVIHHQPLVLWRYNYLDTDVIEDITVISSWNVSNFGDPWCFATLSPIVVVMSAFFPPSSDWKDGLGRWPLWEQWHPPPPPPPLPPLPPRPAMPSHVSLECRERERDRKGRAKNTYEGWWDGMSVTSFSFKHFFRGHFYHSL